MIKDYAMRSRFITGALAALVAASAFVLSATAQEPPRTFKQGEGVSAPRLVKEVKPKYTVEAMDARIEGMVVLDAVVGEDGAVGEVRVTHSLDDVHGLDEEAVKAVKQWQFRPGRKDGVPVAVAVEIELVFKLRKDD